MSDIKIGSLAVQNLMLGSESINALYVGNDLLWERTAPSTQATLTVTPIPETATVTLTITGQPTITGVGPQTVTVEKGTLVNASISNCDYPDTAKITVNYDMEYVLDGSRQYYKATLLAVRDQTSRTSIEGAMLYWDDGVSVKTLGPTIIENTTIRWLTTLGTSIRVYIKDIYGLHVGDSGLDNNVSTLANIPSPPIYATIQVQPQDAWDANVSLNYNIMPLTGTNLGSGQYKFPVSTWSSFNYTVIKEGYNTATGTITTERDSKTFTVTLQPEA